MEGSLEGVSVFLLNNQDMLTIPTLADKRSSLLLHTYLASLGIQLDSYTH